MEMWSSFHNALTYGPLVEKGWKDLGGVECFQSIPWHTHVYESSFWLLIAFLFYKLTNVSHVFQQQTTRLCEKDFPLLRDRYTYTTHSTSGSNTNNSSRESRSVIRTLEVTLGLILFMTFLLITYYKFTSKAGIFLLQPCHLICLVESYALLVDPLTNVWSHLIAIYLLPAMSGSIMALVFPENDDLLLPFEVETFWIEHYLIVLLPIYLLVRMDGIGVRYMKEREGHCIAIGLWFLLVLHFLVHEVISYHLMVNVEFMLCPTKQMETIFTAIFGHSDRVTEYFVSHRTLMTFVVFIVGALIAKLYLMVASICVNCFSFSKRIKKS